MRPPSSHLRLQLFFPARCYKAQGFSPSAALVARCHHQLLLRSHTPSRPGFPSKLHISPVPHRVFSTSRPTMSDASFYSLKATRPGNKEYDFEQLRGKVVLIVNTASKWYVPTLIPVSGARLISRFQRLHAPVQGPRGPLQEVRGPGLRHPRLPVQPGASLSHCIASVLPTNPCLPRFPAVLLLAHPPRPTPCVS